jgi:hypothetical protein
MQIFVTAAMSLQNCGVVWDSLSPSALFLLVTFGLTLLVIELFSGVLKLDKRGRVLAQQLAILRDSLDREIASRKGGRAASPQEG